MEFLKYYRLEFYDLLVKWANMGLYRNRSNNKRACINQLKESGLIQHGGCYKSLMAENSFIILIIQQQRESYRGERK